jgi:hypothetical protein
MLCNAGPREKAEIARKRPVRGGKKQRQTFPVAGSGARGERFEPSMNEFPEKVREVALESETKA